MLTIAPLARYVPAALLAAALVAIGLYPRVAQAEMTAIDVEADLVHAGLGEEESYKLGSWCPVQVELVNSGRGVLGRLEVIAPDDEGRPVAYSLHEPFELAGGEHRAATVEVLIGRPAAELRVRLVQEDGQVLLDHAHRLPDEAAATPEEFVALSVVTDMGLAEAADSPHGNVAIRALHASEAARLPTSFWGYEGIDLVVLSSSIAAPESGFDAERLAALTAWVGQGGRLLVSVGAQGEAMLGPGGLLAELSPFTYLGQTQVREVVQLESFSGSHAPLEYVDENGQRTLIDIALVAPGSAEVVVSQSLRAEETPLIVRGRYGLGQVTLVLCDFDRAPLASWPALPVLMNRLVFDPLREAQSSEGTQSRRAAHLGYDDLRGQLRESLEQFPGVAFVPFWIVALLAVGYILLIGPVDYFLLKGFGRRMGATWFTFPLMAAALAVVIVAVSGAAKSQRPAINQVEVIDIDMVNGYVRGNQWSYFYSPSNNRYNLSGQIAPSAGTLDGGVALRLGWDGRSGTGFGGMSATGPLAISASRGYTISAAGDQAEIAHIPLPASSTRALAARWAARFEPAETPPLRAPADGIIQGSVVNPLEVELRDAWLYHGDSAWPLGDMPAGAVQVLDQDTPAEDLNWRLTRRTIRELQDVTTPWDPTTRDIPRILEVTLFHRAAGGKTYTRLSGATTRQLDMSELLQYEKGPSNRAVLWGRVRTPAMELAVDANSQETDRQSWTIYRMVLPVVVPTRETTTP